MVLENDRKIQVTKVVTGRGLVWLNGRSLGERACLVGKDRDLDAFRTCFSSVFSSGSFFSPANGLLLLLHSSRECLPLQTGKLLS